MSRSSGEMCTTRCQLFRDEIIKNENALRMKWFIKNRQRLLDNLGDEKIVDRAKKNRNKFEEERSKERQEDMEKVEEKSLPLWRLPNADGSVNLNFMKPIDSSVREILYENEVESFVTGNNYLRERCKDKPENRYYYPDCTNWLYGWRITDYPPVPPTKVGKSSIIQETFYRRNASCLQRENENHRQCQPRNAKNYNEILTY